MEGGFQNPGRIQASSGAVQAWPSHHAPEAPDASVLLTDVDQ
jgi:hypothetical protein